MSYSSWVWEHKVAKGELFSQIKELLRFPDGRVPRKNKHAATIPTPHSRPPPSRRPPTSSTISLPQPLLLACRLKVADVEARLRQAGSYTQAPCPSRAQPEPQHQHQP